MPTCCVRSFVEKGVREWFRLANVGDVHTCETCGRRYEMQQFWTEVSAPVPPLNVDDADGEIH